MKIIVYAICKNESGFVDRWMDSMQEADRVIVLDTGSTDDTVQKLRSRGARVYEEQFSPGALIRPGTAPWNWWTTMPISASAPTWTSTSSPDGGRNWSGYGRRE